MSDSSPFPTENNALVSEVRQLIDAAKQRAAVAVKAEISLLYWQVGKRIQQEVLQGERAEYGKQVINQLAKELTEHYGKGWGVRQLRQLATNNPPRLRRFFVSAQTISRGA